MLEVTGGSGYAQVNRENAASQHVCKRTQGADGRSFQCSDPSHQKQPIAKGGLAVLTERRALMATVARFEANADMSVVTEEGDVRLVGGPLSTLRSGHAAFALGERLQHSWGVSDGPSVASIAASQPHGAVSGTFMMSVPSLADAMAQLEIWRASLAPMLPGPGYTFPASCFFFVSDEHMAMLRSQCAHGSMFSAEDSAAGGAHRACSRPRLIYSHHPVQRARSRLRRTRRQGARLATWADGPRQRSQQQHP